MNAPLEPEPAPEEKEAAEEAEMMSKIAEKAKADAKAKAEEEAKGGIGLKTKLDGGLGQYKESGDGLGKIVGGGLNADIDVKAFAAAVQKHEQRSGKSGKGEGR